MSSQTADQRQMEAILDTLTMGEPGSWWLVQKVTDQFCPQLGLMRTGYLLDRLTRECKVERRTRKKSEWGLYPPEGYHRYQYRALTGRAITNEEDTLP
jgi:hypothetical protein